MKPIRIFISSVQQEFAEERTALRDYLWGNPLFRGQTPALSDLFRSEVHALSYPGEAQAYSVLSDLQRDGF